MSVPVWIGVGLLGGCGAVARVWFGAAAAQRLGQVWAGTLLVNLIGAFALGLLSALDSVGRDLHTMIALGFLGAFTTFSTWMVEAERDRARLHGVALLVGALLLGLAAVWLGREVGAQL